MRPYEHYLEAEELLKDLDRCDTATARERVAQAQVHATLALVVEGNFTSDKKPHKPDSPWCPPGCFGQFEDCAYKEDSND